ncbi:DUF2569 family protein [Pseudobacteriovorax antillogorgiicola]|nr:DUF2569 family protein [Pseudobacteriovorax antillogorgiicola]
MTPIKLVSMLIEFRDMYSVETWSALLSEDSDPAISQVAILFTSTNLLLLAVSLVVAWLFFKKRTIFPKFFIGWVIFNQLILFGGIYYTSQTVDIGETLGIKDLVKTLLSPIFAVLCISYMLVSKRVKATFING